jgi:hypothetical protein
MVGTLLQRLALGAYPYPGGGIGLPASAVVDPQALDPQIPTALGPGDAARAGRRPRRSLRHRAGAA